MRSGPASDAPGAATDAADRREREALRALGLARRAGLAVIGTRAVQEAARAGRLAGLVLAGDAADNARRRIAGALAAGVPAVTLADRRRLGHAVGRGPVAVVGITEAGLAERVMAAGRVVG